MADHIFLSYSRDDSEFVSKLATDLEARGAQVWIDRGDLRAGTVWRRSIEAAIQGCRAFVLVISPAAVASEAVNHEISTALVLKKPIFPVIYQGAALPPLMAENLNEFQRLDVQRGGYGENFADLVAGLTASGVPLSAAPEVSPERLAERRRERLGAPVKTSWGAVLRKVPGWAFAWGLGWAVYWLVLPILLLIFGGQLPGDSAGSLVLLPVTGFLGGLAGGVLAGLVTMLVLRRYATNIAWKHMSPSVRIWGLVGPLGTVAAGGLALLLAEFPFIDLLSGLDCSSLGVMDCFSEAIGRTIGSVIASVVVGVVIAVVLILLYALIALFLIGAVAGALAVRHIRRLEPGILGRQAIWVVVGWGLGAIVGALAPLAMAAALQGG